MAPNVALPALGAVVGLVAMVAMALPAAAAVTGTVGNGVLTITTDAPADAIAVTCVGSVVKVNGADPTSGSTFCSAITSIVVTSGTGANAINLSLVTTGNGFTTMTGAIINGGDGDDTIQGSLFADTINGGAGADTIDGLGGNDTITGGTGNDTVNGDDGNDGIVWNNGDGSDVLTITPTAPRVTFARTNAGPFTIDMGTVEGLDVNSLGGEDSITAAAGSPR